MEITTRVQTKTFYGTNEAAHLWLLADGVPVAFIHTHFRPTSGEEEWPSLTLCDIEVREGYRGQGMAVLAITAAEERYPGHTLHTTGTYTPLGFDRLGAHIPTVPYEQATVRVRDMSFVHDWDQMHPEYPL